MEEQENLLEMHAIVNGYVQGIGFRATARQFAVNLGLTGTARNMPDGTVEMYAQGNKETLEKFIKKLQDHFGIGYITSIQIKHSNPSRKFQGFTIVH